MLIAGGILSDRIKDSVHEIEESLETQVALSSGECERYIGDELYVREVLSYL